MMVDEVFTPGLPSLLSLFPPPSHACCLCLTGKSKKRLQVLDFFSDSLPKDAASLSMHLALCTDDYETWVLPGAVLFFLFPLPVLSSSSSLSSSPLLLLLLCCCCAL